MTREPQIAGDVRAMHRLVVHAAARGVEIDVTTNADRKRAVLAHADLADRLCAHPLNYQHASQWSGYIPPEMWQGVPNNSPRRAALVAIYEEACARNATPGQAAA